MYAAAFRVVQPLREWNARLSVGAPLGSLSLKKCFEISLVTVERYKHTKKYLISNFAYKLVY